MGTLITRLTLLQRYFKIRFIFLSVVFIVTSLLLPLWLPYVPEFEPAQSIYSMGEEGHSNLMNQGSSFDISQNYDLTKNYNDYDLVVLINPQRDIGQRELSIFSQYLSRGGKLFIIGKSTIQQVIGEFGFAVNPLAEGDYRIFDEFSNGGDLRFPKITYKQNTYVGIVPTALEIVPSDSEVIHTQSTSAYANCYDIDSPCRDAYNVGFVSSNLAVLADSWMFSNQYTNIYEENIGLFWVIMSDLIGESGSVLFEESFYNWAPLNEKGVQNFIEVRFTVELVGLLIFLLSVVIPLFVGLQARVFDYERKRSLQSQSISQRLNYLHIEKLPAAPLNALENILVTEKIELQSRGKFYLQHIAHELLELFQSEGIYEPNQIIQKLHALSNGHFSLYSSWRVLEEGYDILLSHNNLKR